MAQTQKGTMARPRVARGVSLERKMYNTSARIKNSDRALTVFTKLGRAIGLAGVLMAALSLMVVDQPFEAAYEGTLLLDFTIQYGEIFVTGFFVAVAGWILWLIARSRQLKLEDDRIKREEGRSQG